ncbi:RnfH family protein [Paucibacter sp. PLA-PC-4]|uniref:RnfH family protein n=1 Tax=Paucibacter sp. PLA-PC-4 TaxID=2993655 RepID=UPI00224B9509|nr:RnfH family protein [Paucibacter sp. PLA-PC-4]MCX2864113.1 RnfH family protein [Paucibacter sp. PLA-PC-4]
MVPAEPLRVELVWSPAAGDVRHRWLQLPMGTNLEQALRGCADFADQLPQLATLRIGIWGRIKPLDTLLRERDRIEVYRPLTVDPKEARRLRYRAAGERIVSRHRPLAGKTSR